MKILPASSEGRTHAMSILRSGGVIAHATETCYGLACDLRNPKALEKLFQIKKRPFNQPVSALCSSLSQAEQFVLFSPKALEIAKRYLPGPLTLVLLAREDAPFQIHVCPALSSVSQNSLSLSIGIRLSSHPLAQALSKDFGSPIATTSANLHGEPNPYSIEDIVSQYSSQEFFPDLILDSGPIVVLPASTVVEVKGDRLSVLRQGNLVVI